MANGRPRGSSIFSGLILIFVGGVLLLHNYHDLELSRVFLHWWPLILIVWGAIKLYERTAGSRSGDSGAARITPGEVFLVLGLLALIGTVVAVEQVKDRWGPEILDLGHEPFRSDLDVAPASVPANAGVTIRGGRGDINVRSSDEREIRVNGKKNVRSWNDNDAQRTAGKVSVEIVRNGDGYEVHPTGVGGGDSRVSVDMDVAVPNKSVVTVRNDKGDIRIANMAAPVTINSPNGDIEVHSTTGDVSIDMHRGDAKVTDTTGNVKISGSGDSVEVVDVTGSFTINGEFVGPVHAEKVAKGVRFVSNRTDLTLTSLTGHMEASSGNLEVVDAPGNLNVKSRDEDISIENAGGKVKVEDHNGNVEVRFSWPPKEDIEIYNSSASITLDLPESSSFEIVADCHSGDIDSEFESDTLKKTTTHSGDSHLEGKYGSGRGPKITVKTSYGSISIHKTS
jgi:Domain of unknown function (DUF5668)/Putative adhesin